jgi:hypothetical protein
VNRVISGFALLLLLALPGAAQADTRVATIEWTAPGDDGMVGTAMLYEIRFSRNPITAALFLFATRLNTALLPGPAGTKEHMTVVGLTAGVPYYFAMRAMDNAGNWSPISNIAYLPSDVAAVPGGPIGDAQFSAPSPNPARTGARFSVTLPEPAYMRVEAFDVGGRKVKTIAMGQYSPGSFGVNWDLHDDGGRQLEAGTYLVRSQIGDNVILRRVTVVHLVPVDSNRSAPGASPARNGLDQRHLCRRSVAAREHAGPRGP